MSSNGGWTSPEGRWTNPNGWTNPENGWTSPENQWTNPERTWAPTPASPVRTERSRPVWPAVLTASLASAILASAGTFGVLTATGGTDRVGDSHTAADSSVVVPAAAVADGTVEGVADAVRDSVVAIQVQVGRGGSEGSGVVLDSQGHILTNDHVVAGASAIRVTLADGRVYPAQVVGTDPTTDLAVLTLQGAPQDLAPASLGVSDALVVGQQVVAVGNPLGLSSTVTSGIISALDRPVTTGSGSGERVVTNAIQVDAAINPGNSGGPLFDMGGRVIGINSSIAAMSQRSGSIGLGFAIPVDLASRVAEEIIADGSAQHAMLGVSLTDGQARAGDVVRAGAEVHQVVPDSAAAAAGLQAGDVVVAVDGSPVSGADSLTGYVRAEAPGTTVVLGVVRDGTQQDVDVTLGTA
ncbi:MAG TPA: PDZ domain-containing protein [Actinomycetales bacterium]|nr:PDZ domain-containing protein [Actinomycetales bacterium]